MKILVTGGAGFIGTHLCRKLNQCGHLVTSFDIAEPKTPISGVTYMRGDVRQPETFKTAFKNVDAVYHFAAIVSVPLCQQDPVGTYQTNLIGTCNVLEAAASEMKTRGGVPVKIIFASSAAVYGALGEKDLPLTEVETASQPLSFYGAQKLGAEHAIALFRAVERLPAVVFRFFNVYGPGQDPKSPYSGVISIFSDRLSANKPLLLNGDGQQTRDFISVHDVVDACAKVLELSYENCNALPLNLGSGQSVTVEDLANTMIEICGRTGRTEHGPAREGDIMHSVASIACARNLLNWHPKLKLYDGLKELLNG